MAVEMGFQCMLQMFTSNEPIDNCTSLHCLFPPTEAVTPYEGGSRIKDEWLSNQNRQELMSGWYCGDKMLRVDWTGTCALIQLIMPFLVFNQLGINPC